MLARREGAVGEPLEFYALLSGRRVVENPLFDHHQVPFSVQTRLTREEILYAIKTTLEMNGIAIVPVTGGIQLDYFFRPARPEKPAGEKEKPDSTEGAVREAN